jgi:hypothetical protein
VTVDMDLTDRRRSTDAGLSDWSVTRDDRDAVSTLGNQRRNRTSDTAGTAATVTTRKQTTTYTAYLYDAADAECLYTIEYMLTW